ncbi:MAG: hypothetical protein B1H08_00010 [Candidatus Omnitrophica bacterium 4484_171]|nr:MAG: hypothetical protein B1H08_00010 [Candidatus Omnitrophica bacterium 4484_171]
MKKVEINLYPYQPKEGNKYIKIIERYTPFALLAALGLIAINLILFSITASMSFPYHKFNSEWKQLQPKIGKIEELKKELSSLAAKKKEYRNVLKYKMNISHVFADIYASLPKNIWLGKTRFDEDTIYISGYAVTWKDSPLVSIDIFTRKLRKAKYFSSIFHKVNLKSSRRTIFNTREVMRFEIECRI